MFTRHIISTLVFIMIIVITTFSGCRHSKVANPSERTIYSYQYGDEARVEKVQVGGVYTLFNEGNSITSNFLKAGCEIGFEKNLEGSPFAVAADLRIPISGFPHQWRLMRPEKEITAKERVRVEAYRETDLALNVVGTVLYPPLVMLSPLGLLGR